ncbi:hypothetical protein Salat_2537600 [Sesamum alatum]|uniref:Uncharacterized protein n=1 Tax=Sesamum alatum TaxID=300844 RepID=A0AAE1XT54_9LAMI|nr:hypothetical protein Salat_2537600 [Sesamum alatum]
MGLDDDVYGTIRSNIISQKPLPLLNHTYALIIQEERHRALTRTRDVRTEAVNFAIQGPKSAPSGTTNVVCKSCGKLAMRSNHASKLLGILNGGLLEVGKDQDMVVIPTQWDVANEQMSLLIRPEQLIYLLQPGLQQY